MGHLGGHVRSELGPVHASLGLSRYRVTLGGEDFVLFDSYDDREDDDDDEEARRNRVIVFGTRRNVELLMKCIMWFLDGTFKTAPHIFTQIFTILGLMKRPGPAVDDDDVTTAVPLVFALLPSKTEAHYFDVLQSVKDAAAKFRVRGTGPEKLMTDFEVGIINAAKRAFPEADIKCCFFHLGQSSYRKVQNAGLQEAYNDPEDRTVKEGVHMMLSLAFVPLADVEDALEVVRREVPRAVEVITTYFDDTYVRGPRGRGARRARRPRFDPALWNAYEATLRDEHRTNNLSEGWHNRFQVRVVTTCGVTTA